jgi:RNA polymerase sigma-70 factor (ECF subfamily)
LSRTFSIAPATAAPRLMNHAPPARHRFTTAPLAGTLAPMDVSEDDAALMLRYRDGDLHAFETLYERHRGPLYRYLLRQCRDNEAAADLFQDVWGRVISNRERYQVRARFTTYLFHIAHNCCIDHFRRQSARRTGLTDPVDDWNEQLVSPSHERPDAELARSQLEQAFRASLAELPSEQREVFLLYEETGLTLGEIAYVTGVGMETAKSRLRYALSKLRAALKDDPAVLSADARGS